MNEASIWPPPQEARRLDSVSVLPTRFSIRSRARDLAPVFEAFAARLRPHGLEVRVDPGAAASPGEATIFVDEAPTSWRPPQSYSLAVTSTITVLAADTAGYRHAFATLAQHLRSLERSGATLRGPALTVRDWPDFLVRGVMLDVSRTRVPRMDALFALVDQLAAWKINQLQLYMEHTFAYRGHEDAWRDASPFTGAEIDALDERCASLGVELVPNQQSFGHMHRWLKHERYRDLAEVPEGVDHAFSIDREPYSLDLSDPRALALLDDLYDQLLPHFRAHEFNVGLDETFDLGLGKSRAACEARGRERVYLEYLCAVREKVVARGKRMQFWGDIVLQRPELVPELPKDLIALEWGYDEGHPFAEHVRHFKESGLTFYVCPGTSSWQSVAGRTRNMLGNVREAARHGHEGGALGYLITDWGDRGHLQPRSILHPGLCAGAAVAWNAGYAPRLDRESLAAALDEHVYLDDARVAGRLVLELGDAYLECGAKSTNGSALFFLLAFARDPLPHARMPDLDAAGLRRARAYLLERRPRVDEIRSRRPDADALRAELRWIVDVLVFACDFGVARTETAPGSPVLAIDERTRADLARRLRPLIVEHATSWLRHDRPGGLPESRAWLERVLALLEA